MDLSDRRAAGKGDPGGWYPPRIPQLSLSTMGEPGSTPGVLVAVKKRRVLNERATKDKVR